jgi:hypothetical protein
VLLRLCEVSVRGDRLSEARDWFQKALAETFGAAQRRGAFAELAALFDRPDFQDLLPPGKGDKE